MDCDIGLIIILNILDWEKMLVYFFCVIVEYEQYWFLYVEVDFIINVDDVNDNVFVFEVFFYSKVIFEDLYVGDIVIDVCVCDLDVG